MENADAATNHPLSPGDPQRILLAHGGGGKMTQELIAGVFQPAFANPWLDQRHDGAVIAPPAGKIAFTTDSYVVRPLFFPGGDIGTLAVTGSVNDLAMCGARPLFLSAGFIIEEGLPLADVQRIANSMRERARAAKVEIVTADTKVVEKGKGDGIFINTAAIGVIEHELTIEPRAVQNGDAVLLSGDLGRHGIAILAARENLDFETALESDCACLAEPVLALLEAGIEVHCLRDLTRGGLATALLEIAQGAKRHIHLEEDAIPIPEQVAGICEILGLDPLYVANEGRFVAFIPEAQVQRALSIINARAPGGPARWIGSVTDGEPLVTIKSKVGATRLVDMLSGEQLPRIC